MISLAIFGCKQSEELGTSGIPETGGGTGGIGIVNPGQGGGESPSGGLGSGGQTRSAPISDVTIEGVSILGAWHALEVQGDAVATRDLQDGTMKMTLLVQPNGRATLAGIDNREGTGEAVRFDGQISGNRLALDGLPGAATLFMSGRRLVLRDPRGKSTVYIRGVDG